VDSVGLKNEFQISQTGNAVITTERLQGFISEAHIFYIKNDPWTAVPNIHVHQYKNISQQVF
jgi:hypothetical protein